MKMVGYEAIGMDLKAGFLAGFGEGFGEIVAIDIIEKDAFAAVA